MGPAGGWRRRGLGAVVLLAAAAGLGGCSSLGLAGDGGQRTAIPGIAADGAEEEQPPLLQETVVVSEGYATGTFVRAFYLEAKDRVLVTFGTGDYTGIVALGDPGGPGPGQPGGGPPPAGAPAGCLDTKMGYAYREFTADMGTAGNDGYFVKLDQSCAGGDIASLMVDGSYYLLAGSPVGWRLTRFDDSWKQTGSVEIPLNRDTHANNDQMLAYANGEIVASSLYAKDGFGAGKANPERGEATFHVRLTKDLQILGERIVDDVPHVNGSSLVFANSEYTLVTSRAYFGALLALRFDEGWNFLGEKELAQWGQWPQGTVFHDGRYYVAYLDVTDRMAANAALGVYDQEWDHVTTIPITQFTFNDGKQAGRPSVMYHGGRLYVTYDVETFKREGHRDQKDWVAMLSVFALDP